jgi:hypothetical protein
MSNQSDEIWRLAYWYPSNDHDGYDVSEYEMRSHHAGKALIFESAPNKEGSYMFARLTKDDNIYSGTWYESTSPSGSFVGAQYSGAGQLLMSEDGNTLEGMWAGAGFDREEKKMRIYSGEWKITRDLAT